MVVLKVSYRVRVDHIREFEKIFASELMPVVKAHRLSLLGIWKTLVGNVGEFLELWEFSSVADFEKRWKPFLNDSRVQEIFRSTGSMVENETFALLEPALGGDSL